MRAYGVKQSFRPTCNCCNTRHLHHYRISRTYAYIIRAKRAAKRKERFKAKREIVNQIYDRNYCV